MTENFFGLPQKRDAYLAIFFSLFFTLFFVFFYGGASVLAPFIPWHFTIHFSFESQIPFMPEAALVYLSLNVLLGCAPFVLRRWDSLLPLFICLLLETLIGTFCFLLFPVQTNFPPRHVEGMTGMIFNFADTVNLNGNFFPSLHVAFACTATLAILPRTNKLGAFMLWLWTTAIALSTILIHEHHLLDIVGGIGLAFFVWRSVRLWIARTNVIADFHIEILCVRDVILFSQRHRRYLLIALGLYLESLLGWRRHRILRVGFCFLQHIDDLLDGDRPTDREPLELVDDITLAIFTKQFGASDLMCMAQAFTTDLMKLKGESAIETALALIANMRQDRCRVTEHTTLSREELKQHQHATFSLSIDLMLIARASPLRASDVPELIDLLAWCSTVRDLKEDIDAGLINLPREILDAADFKIKRSYDMLIVNPAVRTWLKCEHEHALQLLPALHKKLVKLKNQKGIASLRILSSSIQGFATKRFPRLFPFCEHITHTASQSQSA